MSITLAAIREEWKAEVQKGETRSFVTWLTDAGLSITGDRVEAAPRPPWVDELLAEIRSLKTNPPMVEFPSTVEGVTYLQVERDCPYNKLENPRRVKRYDYKVLYENTPVAIFKSKGLNRDFILCNLDGKVLHKDFTMQLYTAKAPVVFDQAYRQAIKEGLANCLIGRDFHNV
jgi:hypothetical protein